MQLFFVALNQVKAQQWAGYSPGMRVSSDAAAATAAVTVVTRLYDGRLSTSSGYSLPVLRPPRNRCVLKPTVIGLAQSIYCMVCNVVENITTLRRRWYRLSKLCRFLHAYTWQIVPRKVNERPSKILTVITSCVVFVLRMGLRLTSAADAAAALRDAVIIPRCYYCQRSGSARHLLYSRAFLQCCVSIGGSAIAAPAEYCMKRTRLLTVTD